jgi:hypothetical protein
MHRVSSIVTGISAVLMVSGIAMLVGCQRDQGPVGPAGKTGGDGTAACGTCHSVSTDILAKQIQWNNSVHATGGNFARSDAGCAPCHTSEGFRETLGTVQPKMAAAKIENPTPQNCRTCHNIHQKFDLTDFNLATTAPVQLITGGIINIGKGNICAECHQPRLANPQPVVGGPNVTLTSSRYGVHHGPQASVLFGEGGYEIPGTEKYDKSPHVAIVPDGCVTCHMATPYGNLAGGHTLNMAYGTPGTDNVAGCLKCHTTAKNFDVDGVQTEVTALLAQFKTLLINAKLMSSDLVFVLGTYPADKAGVMLNYQLITEDKSLGVHNAKYVKAILKNSIAYLQKSL